MFGIGEASTRSGVKIETIRYYERSGIVPPPPRSPAGRRVYDPDAVARLRFVKRCRDLGFPIASIRALLALGPAASAPCAEVRSIAEGHLAEIDDKISQLQTLRDAVQGLAASCEADAAPCGLLHTLMSDKPDCPAIAR